VPSMSMIYVASPTASAWLHRLVYYPDTKMYDLIPEYQFPNMLFLPTGGRHHSPEIAATNYCGAVVQPLRFAEELFAEDEREVDDGGMGVTVVAVTVRGNASWWTVKRPDDNGHVGVEDIVL
jgi:hypothetical protein